jgi:hypothetical protein
MKSVLEPLDISFAGVVERLLGFARALRRRRRRRRAHPARGRRPRAGDLLRHPGRRPPLGLPRHRRGHRPRQRRGDPRGRTRPRRAPGRQGPVQPRRRGPAGHRHPRRAPRHRRARRQAAAAVRDRRGGHPPARRDPVIVEVQEVREEGSPAAPQLLNPDTLTIMPRPVLGVESVRNIEPLRQRQADESDDQLRARARTVLRESQRGTAPAIAAAVREQGLVNVEVREPADRPPGVLEVIISDPGFEKDLLAQERVRRAVRATKAAGVRAVVQFVRTVYPPADHRHRPDRPAARRPRVRAPARRAARRPRQIRRRPPERAERQPPQARGDPVRSPRRPGHHRPAPQFVHPRPRRALPARPLAPAPITSGRGVTDDTGDVIVRAYERPSLDLERFPPIIARDRTPLLQLDLVVRVARVDAVAREAVRTALNGFATRLPTSRTRTKSRSSPSSWPCLAVRRRHRDPPRRHHRRVRLRPHPRRRGAPRQPARGRPPGPRRRRPRPRPDQGDP